VESVLEPSSIGGPRSGALVSLAQHAIRDLRVTVS